MTLPSPFDATDGYDTLRRRWYAPYLTVENQHLKEIRDFLVAGSDEAQKKINALLKRKNYEDSVRVVQIRLAKKEMQTVVKDIFSGLGPIIQRGQRRSARTAVEALSATDRRYLLALFGSPRQVDNFIRGQQTASMLQVNNSISRITKTRLPLSTRVYKSQSLANHWVDNLVTTSIMRGDSAKEIADAVERHIRPDTPGGTSYAAMRLGRTEINNAFHATAITLSQDRPWIESMAWNLSKTHISTPMRAWQAGQIEVCELYAARTWEVNQVPAKPHPQCRCFVTPQLEAYEVFLSHLKAGQYRDWTQNAA